MKQIIQSYKNGKLQLQDMPAPLCKDGGVLVSTKFSLVSAGTERLMIDLARKSVLGKAKERPDLVQKILNKVSTEGLMATLQKVSNRLDEPAALGYSCSGEVIKVGGSVSGFNEGDRVACAGAGYACHSQINYIPQNLCVKVPDNVGFDEAAFVTLGAIAMQGIRRAGLSVGEKVGVIGLGLIGQLTVQILSAYGFPVLGMDIDEKKVKRSLDSGMDKGAVIGQDNIDLNAKSFTEGKGLDAVIIAAFTKSDEPVRLAGQISRLAGRVVSVGLVGMKVQRDIYYEKELDLRISRSYGPGRYDPDYEKKGQDYPYSYVRWTEKRNMEEFLRLTGKGRVDVKAMITHKFKFQDYEKAYELILKNNCKEDRVGVLLEYDSVKETEPVIILDGSDKISADLDAVGIGLIGCGNFAKNIILPGLRRFKKVNIRAVATVTAKDARHIGNKYKCRYCTTDYMKILEDDKIKAVFVTTRHDLHAQMVTESLKHGKNVFVEKPLCLNQRELQDIIHVYQEQRAHSQAPKIMVGFNRRFSPGVKRVKNIFKGRNTPLMINYRVNAGYIPAGHWVHDHKEGGGRIIGEVCHFVDLLQYLVGSDPVKVYATGLPVQGEVLSDDNVIIVIDFSDGSRGNIIYTALGSPALGKEYIEIFGDKNCAVINDFKSGWFRLGQDKGHCRELKSFIQGVLGRRMWPVAFNEILSSTLTTLKIVQSLELGKPVTVDLSEVIDS